MTTWKRSFLTATSVALSGFAYGAVADETGIGHEGSYPFASLEDETESSISLWDEIAEWFEEKYSRRMTNP